MNINPAAIWVPEKPSAGESCPGSYSPTFMLKQNSGQLPALMVMLLTKLLSQGHERILLPEIQFEGLCFGVFIFFFEFPYTLKAEDHTFLGKCWSAFLGHKGPLSAEGTTQGTVSIPVRMLKPRLSTRISSSPSLSRE